MSNITTMTTGIRPAFGMPSDCTYRVGQGTAVSGHVLGSAPVRERKAVITAPATTDFAWVLHAWRPPLT